MNVSSAPIRVLHVDDEPDLADMAASFLERKDDRFEIETARNTNEGLSRLSDDEFDCVVSDYDMPGQNGIEFLETVREEYAELPFILYTGKGSEEVASDAISAGVTDYLQKETGTSQYTVLANRIRNVVENYRTQIELSDREQRLTLFFEQSPLGVIEWDETFSVVRMNEAAEDILGCSEAELAGESWESIVPESNRKPVADVVTDLLENEGGYHSINENVRNDGERIVCEWHNRVVTDEDDVVAVFSQFQNVTDRRERKQRLETMIDNLPGYVYRHGLEHEWPLEFVGGASQQITGYTPAELVSDLALAEKVIHPEDREKVQTGVEDGLEADGHYDLTYRITTKEGERRWVRDRGTVVTDPVTGVEKLEGLVTDITEPKTQQQDLKQRTERLIELTDRLEDQYDHLFEEAPIMIVETRVTNGEPIIEDCNQLFVETVGYPKTAVLDRRLVEFYTADSRRRLLDEGGYERLLNGRSTREDRELVAADGEVVETLSRAVPRYDATDEIIGTIAYHIDITERKELKRERDQLEEFTSIVSHDLRNPLSVATGRLELARDEFESEHLDAVANAHERMRSLIDDLLALARETKTEDVVLESVALASMIKNCWMNVDTKEATLVADTGCTIRAERGRLAQLVENLLRNAVEHGGEDVTITIGELDDGFYVADDGIGIPEAERDDVFTSGYSTTESGTGFGLSIVKQVADAHGWEVHVTDGPNGGVRFEITGVELDT